MRDTNTAYNAKEDEANDLKREKGDLMLEIGRKEEEIKKLEVCKGDEERGKRKAERERERKIQEVREKKRVEDKVEKGMRNG